MKKNGGLIAALIAAVVLLCGFGVGLPLMFAGQAAANPCNNGTVIPDLTQPSGTPDRFGEWDGAQVRNAAAIITAGQNLAIPARGWVIAVATAMQESTLHNLANTNVPASLHLPHEGEGHDHDSVGIMQQRPNPPDGAGTWGPVAELMTPAIAAKKFYLALVKIGGWQQMRLTDAAQAVQHSGFPDAYQKWEQPANDLVAHLLGLPNLDAVGGGDPGLPCGPTSAGPVPVGPSGWVQPVHATIVSGFRTADRPTHDGVDLGAPRNTVIRAAATGTVVYADCDPGTAQTVGSCDRDGSAQASGCGWYVDIWHPGNIVTRYCHMRTHPDVHTGEQVQAGQVIGLVGTSGNSSGPHLHYEVHLDVAKGGYAGHDNATNPTDWMHDHGAELGQ